MKITRILTVILLSCIILTTFSFVGCSEDDGAPEGYQLASNYGDKFRLYVPTQGWTVNTDGGNTGATRTIDPPVSVSVSVADDADGMSVEEYWAYTEARLSAELDNYALVGTNEESGESAALLGGEPVKTCVYCADVSVKKDDKLVTLRYKFLTLLCKKDGEMYVFLYCAPEETHYEANYSDVKGIIENFTFAEEYKGQHKGDVISGVEIPDGMKLVSFDEHPYLFFVPEKWKINDRAVISAAYIPEDNSNVSLQMHMVSEKEIEKTVEEYFTECEERYKEIFESYTLVEDECGEIKMSGRPARKYVYEIENGGVKYKQMQAIVVKGGVFYTLTYTARPDDFNDHIDDVNDMIESFRIR